MAVAGPERMFQSSSGKGSPVAGNIARVSNSWRRRRNDADHSLSLSCRSGPVSVKIVLDHAEVARLSGHRLIGNECHPVVGPEGELPQLEGQQVQEIFLALSRGHYSQERAGGHEQGEPL